MVNASLIFARITLDIQVKILTLDTLTCNIFYFFTNIAFISSLFIHVNFFKLFFLALLLVVQLTELCFFIYQRAKEITDFLEIRIFCVNNQPSLI